MRYYIGIDTHSSTSTAVGVGEKGDRHISELGIVLGRQQYTFFVSPAGERVPLCKVASFLK